MGRRRLAAAHDAEPSGRSAHGMAFDGGRSVTVMFGGVLSNGGFAGDLWEWDGVTWSQRPSLNGPTPRAGHGMVFDAQRQRVLLFGGQDASGHCDDLWSWDGTTWSFLVSGVVPARSGFGMAFDGARGVALVHGGVGAGATPLDDLWVWNGSTWSSGPSGPPARSQHALAYDPSRATTLLFGGRDDRGSSSAMWQWDGVRWMDLRTESPPPSFDPAMARSAGGNRVVHFGGFSTGMLDDTWEWDGAQWLLRLPSNRPPGRYRHAMALDRLRDRVVLFSGADTNSVLLSDTWEWDGNDWWPLSPDRSPPPRELHAMAPSSVQGRVVLLGGLANYGSGGVLDDFWEWDGAAWRRLPSRPVARYGHGMVFDARRGVTVMFGGRGSRAVLSDTWEWDGSSWSNPQPGVAPPARLRFSMAYDDARERVVVYGGESYDSPTSFDDVWEWDGSNWLQRLQTDPPGARVAAPASFDRVRSRVFLHGGYLTLNSPFVTSNTGMQSWHYGAVHQASTRAFGTACAGSAGLPSLAVEGRPWLGDVLTFDVSPLPPTAPVAILFGVSDAHWQGVPLPLSLGSLGMPGCELFTSVDVGVGMTTLGTHATLSLPIPMVASLAGSTAFAQAFVADAMANAAGVVATHAVAVTLGSR